jgi:hypothetical protein
VLLPSADPFVRDRTVETDGRDISWEKLECRDCHQLEQDGKRMAPISYQKHCLHCHPLSYSEKLSGGGQGPLTHRFPLSKVFQEAQGRLRDYLRKAHRADSGGADESSQPPRLPSKHEDDEEDGSQFEETWSSLREVVKGGCAHCHFFSAGSGGDPESALVITPPKIPSSPDRWLPNATFRHDLHRNYACVACHDPTAVTDESNYRQGSDSERERLLSSRHTSDILMPSVAVCQKCHVDGYRAPWVRANANCVECHLYHPE